MTRRGSLGSGQCAPTTGRGALRLLGALAAGGVLAGSLVACSGEQPLGNTRWQVSAIVSDPDSDANRPNLLTPEAQVRTSLVFGNRDVIGESGCVNFRGKVKWNSEHTQITFPKLESQVREDVACRGEDEVNAQRLTAVLEGHTLDVVSRENSDLELRVAGGEFEQWQTRPAVHLIASGGR